MYPKIGGWHCKFADKNSVVDCYHVLPFPSKKTPPEL